MTVFIFEGPDGAGKTFTASQFSEAVNLPIHHSGGPPKSKEEIIERAKIITQKDNIIHDRATVITDQIYERVVRKGTPPFSMLDLDFLFPDHDEYDHKDYRVIYCRPSIQTIAGVLLEPKPHKNQKHVDACRENISGIISAYDALMSRIPHIAFNRDFQDLEGLFRSLKKMI